MAIQYVGGQTTDITIGDKTITFALTGGLASVPAAGDFVLVSVAVATGATDLSVGVTTSGYSEITELFSNDTYASNLSVSRKFMGATPDTTVTVTGKSSSSNGGVAVIQVYRGVDPTTPLDVTATLYPGTNTAIVNPAAITPITSGAYIVISGMGAHTRGTTGTYTAPYLTSFIQLALNNTYECTAAMGYVPWTSGSYNPEPWTFNASDSTSFSYAVATMALRPAASSGITGTASGSVTSTGSAIGSLPIASSASGAETASGTASGATAVAAGASGGLTTAGSSTGAAVVSASASGQTSVTGSATGGMIAITGEASTTYLISGSSAGGAPTPISADASGDLPLSGSSSAQASISGSAASTYTISGRSGENVSFIRYGEEVVIAAYFGNTPVNVIAVGDHVVLEW